MALTTINCVIDYRIGLLRNNAHNLFPLSLIFNDIKSYELDLRTDRIISSIEWSPFKINLFAVGSRGGDVRLVKIKLDTIYSKINRVFDHEINYWPGNGRGTAINGIKWDNLNENIFYTSSATGEISRRDCNVNGRTSQSFIHLGPDHRFTCLSINKEKSLLASGDNNGYMHLFPLNAKSKSYNQKCHTGHILHCEFNPIESNLIVTCSIDKSLKIWDLRSISSKSKPLLNYERKNLINGATFNHSNGSLLIAADNRDLIYLYRGPNWDLSQIISHEHRQFQEISLIKPCWHPSLDLFIIGSSIKPKSKTTIDKIVSNFDIFAFNNNVYQYRKIKGKQPGTLGTNVFNCTGNMIASTRGPKVLIWTKDFIEN